MKTTGSNEMRRCGSRQSPVADVTPDPLSIAHLIRHAVNTPGGNTLKNLVRVMVLGGFLALAPAGTALAACGFGTALWEGNDNIAAKIVAFTTNYLTFKSISTTSEISGCGEEDNLFKKIASAKLRYYASQNLDHLASDFARGQGEHLDAIAHLIQIRAEDREDFQTLAQNHFESLFPHDRVTAGEMLEQLSQLMTENNALANYVEG
jgi:hypothetical protein